MKYIKYVREHYNDPKSPVVTIQEMRTILNPKGIKAAYLKRLINYLMKNGEMKRITKGIYTFHDDITVVGFAFRPFYYGLENALTIRKIWEQGTNPTIITPNHVRSGQRKFGNGNYNVLKIKKSQFFGYDLIKYYDFWTPVSDYEKTLIDFVYFNHYLRNDVLETIKLELDKKKLDEYLKAYTSKTRFKVRELLKL
jgi:predicted transcriptional regulator of viral defense system